MTIGPLTIEWTHNANWLPLFFGYRWRGGWRVYIGKLSLTYTSVQS